MKRKPSAPAKRNPFVLLAVRGMQRKAGSHSKPEKVLRREEKVNLMRGFSSVGRASGFYPERPEFDPRSPYQKSISESNQLPKVLCKISPDGGIGRRGRLKICYRKVCQFDSGSGHQQT